MLQERCETCDNCRRGLAQLAIGRSASAEAKPEQNEIADTETKLNIGDQVSLPRYGSGRVAEIDDDALVVSFPDGKNRKFKREFGARSHDLVRRCSALPPEPASAHPGHCGWCRRS